MGWSYEDLRFLGNQPWGPTWLCILSFCLKVGYFDFVKQNGERVETRRALTSANRTCCVHSIQAPTMKCLYELFRTHCGLHPLGALAVKFTSGVRTPCGSHLLCSHSVWFAPPVFALHVVRTSGVRTPCGLHLLHSKCMDPYQV